VSVVCGCWCVGCGSVCVCVVCDGNVSEFVVCGWCVCAVCVFVSVCVWCVGGVGVSIVGGVYFVFFCVFVRWVIFVSVWPLGDM